MPVRRPFTMRIRAKDIGRPHCGREAAVGVVRDAQRIRFIVERDDARHGSEDFFARDSVGGVDVVEDRRLDEVAAIECGAERASGGSGPAAGHKQPQENPAPLLTDDQPLSPPHRTLPPGAA
jgi:hypothetical protein